MESNIIPYNIIVNTYSLSNCTKRGFFIHWCVCVCVCVFFFNKLHMVL